MTKTFVYGYTVRGGSYDVFMVLNVPSIVIHNQNAAGRTRRRGFRLVRVLA